MHENERGADRARDDRRYTTYLIVIALAGLALVSYDFNLLVLAIPDIARQLNLSESRVGSLIFFISAAQFVRRQLVLLSAIWLAFGASIDVMVPPSPNSWLTCPDRFECRSPWY